MDSLRLIRQDCNQQCTLITQRKLKSIFTKMKNVHTTRKCRICVLVHSSVLRIPATNLQLLTTIGYMWTLLYENDCKRKLNLKHPTCLDKINILETLNMDLTVSLTINMQRQDLHPAD